MQLSRCRLGGAHYILAGGVSLVLHGAAARRRSPLPRFRLCPESNDGRSLMPNVKRQVGQLGYTAVAEQELCFYGNP